MSEQKWVAGWSLPGCIPEMEPAYFDTEAEAIDFIHNEREMVADLYGDDYIDPYEYWVMPLAFDERV